MTTEIFWHRRDLRPQAPLKSNHFVPLYIFTDEKIGAASEWWLYHALEDLDQEYRKRGTRLILRKGDPLKVLSKLASELKADRISCNAIWEPPHYAQDEKLKKAFEHFEIRNENYLLDPRELLVKGDHPYRVFTPFYHAALKAMDSPSLPRVPKKFPSLAHLRSEKLEMPHEKWMDKLERYWVPTRAEGLKLLRRFVAKKASHYAKERDFPSEASTSSLSPYLHYGQLSIHEVWEAAKKHPAYLRQLMWREFSNYFLFHFPDCLKENWNKKFDRFPWVYNRSYSRKWQKGQTGIPIVDAGMRQLWETGWMHNRLRLIVASFLTKDLLIDWREGEKWFFDTLVDADKPNNIMGWQWVAGCGPDAAPYFRIFNPVLQGQKFDPDGEFIRRYVPELKKLPNKWIHRPWEAPTEILEEANVILDRTYPKPIINHEEARKRVLKAFHA